MKKHIGSFNAADANGKIYKIDVYQHFVVSRSLNSTETSPGRKEYRFGTGPVNLIDDQTFQIVHTDTEVKKVA